jgi:hypothetical protein
MVIVKANKQSEAGELPSEKELAEIRQVFETPEFAESGVRAHRTPASGRSIE